MVKAGEVGEKERALCSCFWTLFGMKKEAQFPVPWIGGNPTGPS